MNEEKYKQKLEDYAEYDTLCTAILSIVKEAFDEGYARGQFDMKQRKSQDLHALKDLVIAFKDDFVDEVIERL